MASKKKSDAGSPGGSEGDLEVLKQLVALLDGSSATSIKLARGEVSYEVSRGGMMVSAPMAMHVAGAGHSAPPPSSSPSSPASPSVSSSPAVSNLVDIKSPMVGTFYRSPEPGAEPYVKAGSRIAPGQTLCIIEAMKIMNELESEVSGTIREILADDTLPVEFGQVLFRVEP